MGKTTGKSFKLLLMFMTFIFVFGISIAGEKRTAYAFGGNWNINGYSSENHCQIQMTKAANGDLYITGYSFYTYIQQYNQKSLYNSSTGRYSTGDHYYELIFNGKTYYDELAPSSSLNLTSMAVDGGSGSTNGNIAVGTNLNLNYNQVSFRFVIPFSDIAGINPMTANDLTLKLKNVLTNVRYGSANATPRTASYTNSKLATVKYNDSASVTYTINRNNAGHLSSWKGYNFTIKFASEVVQNVYVNAGAVMARTTPKQTGYGVNYNYNTGRLTRRDQYSDRSIVYNVENTALTPQSGCGGFINWTPLKVSYSTTSTTTKNATETEIKNNPQYISANNEYIQASLEYTKAMSEYTAYVTNPSHATGSRQPNSLPKIDIWRATLSRNVDTAYEKMQASYNKLQNVIAGISTTSTTITNRQNGILYASSIYLEGFGNNYGIRADLSGLSYDIRLIYRTKKEGDTSWTTKSSSWITPSASSRINILASWCSDSSTYKGYRIGSRTISGNGTVNYTAKQTSYSGTADFSTYKAGSTVYVDVVYTNDKPVIAVRDNSVDLNTNVTDSIIRNKLLKSVTDKEDGSIGIADSRIKYTIKNSKGQTVTKIDTSEETTYTVEFSYTDKGGKTGTDKAKLEVVDPNAHLSIQYNIHIQDPNDITYSGYRDLINYKSYTKLVQKGKAFEFYDRDYLNINKTLMSKISNLTGYCLDYVTVKRSDTGYTQRFNASTDKAAYYNTTSTVYFNQKYSKTNTVIYVDVYFKNLKSGMGNGK